MILCLVVNRTNKLHSNPTRYPLFSSAIQIFGPASRNQRWGRVSLILSLDDTRFWNPGDRCSVQSFRGSLDSVNYALCMNSVSGFGGRSHENASRFPGEIRGDPELPRL